MPNGKYKIVLSLATIFFGLAVFAYTTASETDGTVDSTYKYAWSNNVGWLNFGNTGGNVHITDSGITGYAWNDNYGWINLSPAQSGVHITADGALYGYAWGENVGWISFSGVNISCSGHFSGSATGDVSGTVTFDCTNCNVTTDYQPSKCRGGGGGGPIEPPLTCGNGTCTLPETCSSCPSDCGACLPVCGDSSCAVGTETCASCPADCGVCTPTCGNGLCQPPETCQSCQADCGACLPEPSCGDNSCNNNETCSSCPTDCGLCVPTCGDATCNGTETCSTCVQDCGTCPFLCGDSSCNGTETCGNCPTDCGTCPTLPPGGGGEVCGNKFCGGNETCASCPADCGACQTPPPIIPIIPPAIIENVVKNVQKTAQETTKIIQETAKEVKKIVEIPQVSVTSKIISTTGAAVPAVVATSGFFFSFSNISLFLLRLLNLLMVALGIRKKSRPWGTVYDSITKQPIDPAYVVLKDINGKDVLSAITDLEGRYGFLVKPGIYKMTVSKTNYAFPSQKLTDRLSDEVYDNLYFGETLESKQSETITKNIPLDPIKFDWNEYAKKSKVLVAFYSKFDLFFRKISDILFIIGFVVASISFVFAPYPYNTIVLVIYLLLLLMRALGVKPKPFGFITEKLTKKPLAFAVLRIVEPESGKEIASKVADKYGRYYCLLPRGRYYVKIEKKNDDQTYSLVHISPIIDTSKKGIIKKRFEI